MVYYALLVTSMVLFNCMILETMKERNNFKVSHNSVNIKIDHGRAVRALKFSPNNQVLISAGEDLHINITDVEALKRK